MYSPGRIKCLIVTILLSLITPSHVLAANFTVAGVSLQKNVTPMREIKRQNIVSQSLDFSCGPAGLSTLLNYYLNEKVSEAEIIQTLLKTVPLEKVKARHGFSLLDLKNFALSRGYKVTGYRMNEKFLRELKEPVLVPIKFKNYHHFVIIKGVSGDRVFIADPSAGNMSMKIGKFLSMWTSGIGLVVEKDDRNQKPAKYALQVNKKDIIISDYQEIRRLTDISTFRTTIHPGEF